MNPPHPAREVTQLEDEVACFYLFLLVSVSWANSCHLRSAPDVPTRAFSSRAESRCFDDEREAVFMGECRDHELCFASLTCRESSVEEAVLQHVGIAARPAEGAFVDQLASVGVEEGAAEVDAIADPQSPSAVVTRFRFEPEFFGLRAEPDAQFDIGFHRDFDRGVIHQASPPVEHTKLCLTRAERLELDAVAEQLRVEYVFVGALDLVLAIGVQAVHLHVGFRADHEGRQFAPQHARQQVRVLELEPSSIARRAVAERTPEDAECKCDVRAPDAPAETARVRSVHMRGAAGHARRLAHAASCGVARRARNVYTGCCRPGLVVSSPRERAVAWCDSPLVPVCGTRQLGIRSVEGAASRLNSTPPKKRTHGARGAFWDVYAALVDRIAGGSYCS